MNSNANTKKDYINNGDRVQVKDLPDAPIMIAIRNEREHHGDSNKLKGVLCFWFTRDHQYQQALFNTKDLQRAPGPYRTSHEPVKCTGFTIPVLTEKIEQV